MDDDDGTLEPDPALADLSDEEQVALIEQTDNRLSPEDEALLEQPPQDPAWTPPSTEVDA